MAQFGLMFQDAEDGEIMIDWEMQPEIIPGTNPEDLTPAQIAGLSVINFVFKQLFPSDDASPAGPWDASLDMPSDDDVTEV